MISLTGRLRAILGGHMKPTEDKIRFIEMRAGGNSYAKIAQELGVAKQTAINWSKELKTEIANLRAIEMDALIRSNELHQAARLQLFGKVLNDLKRELDKRDLSSPSFGETLRVNVEIFRRSSKRRDRAKFFQGMYPQ